MQRHPSFAGGGGVLLPQPISETVIPKTLSTAPHPAHFAEYVLYVAGPYESTAHDPIHHAVYGRSKLPGIQHAIYIQDVNLLVERKPWMRDLPVLVARQTKHAFTRENAVYEMDRFAEELRQSNRQIVLPPASEQPVTALTADNAQEWSQAMGVTNTRVQGQEFVVLRPPDDAQELLGAPVMLGKDERVTEDRIRQYLQMRNATAPPHAQQPYWPGLVAAAPSPSQLTPPQHNNDNAQHHYQYQQQNRNGHGNYGYPTTTTTALPHHQQQPPHASYYAAHPPSNGFYQQQNEAIINNNNSSHHHSHRETPRAGGGSPHHYTAPSSSYQ